LIHPTAIIDTHAELDSSVNVGAYSIIEGAVTIDADTWIGPHVVIKGPTQIGRENRIYQFASLGEIAQDKKYAGELEPRLEIGDRNEIREFCTMNRGTVQGGGVTRIGNDNWIMAYTHFAHDCQIGHHTVFANNASVAGHVEVDDYVILGGFSAVHQFCKIGAHAFIGGGSILLKDVPPYITVSGYPAEPFGLNKEGLRRRGFNNETLRQLQQAYKIIYKQNYTIEQAIEKLTELQSECEAVTLFIEFLQASTRGIVR